MKELEPFKTYNPVKPGEGLPIGCSGADVVPRGESVGCVKADSEAISVFGTGIGNEPQ